ncbi:hypothetical protein [Phytoactinopolyspora halophila]|nr:hypothetical protein [Phytoactinopolyspora halophila]
MSETCSVRWCQEPPNHSTRHRRDLGETHSTEMFVRLFLDAAPTDMTPQLAIAMGYIGHRPYAATTLTWSAWERLIGLMVDAHPKYAPRRREQADRRHRQP